MEQPDKLLERAQNGDIRAFQSLFLEFQPQLKSYLYRLTANRNETEDLAQDTFVLAFENIHTFRSESTLKTWVFTVATHHAMKHLKKKHRWTVDTSEKTRAFAHDHEEVMDLLLHTNQSSPQGVFEVREHIDYCFTCISKVLPIEQQVALILKDVYDFKVKEIAKIMDATQGVVKHLLHNARQTMIRIFDQQCALVAKNGVCYQCSGLNNLFNPKQNAQAELIKIKMVGEATDKDKQELYRLRTELIKGIDPLEAKGTELHEVFMKINHRVNEE
jgi:RNA polymerase sigma-70 factor (ECF subfamily)